MGEDLKRTPLFEEHVRAGGKIIPFAGYEMPVQYATGIVAEHHAVRQRAGLFDVSHMGEFEVRGARALDFVQYVTTNDASTLDVGQAQYSVICQEDGCALDDCLVYRFEDHFMVVVNASNRDKDLDWFRKFADGFGVEVLDHSDATGLLALQGPVAEEILSRLTNADLSTIGYYRFAPGRVADLHALISRTGYTGEDGFEIYLAADDAPHLWRSLLEAGKDDGLIPVGLGARDSLRLEMGYILYGNDLDENHTPLEAGLGWVTKLEKDSDFLGRAALVRQKTEGLRSKLVGFELKERGFPRHGYEARWNGEPAGEVTSGTVSPTLEKGVGMAYVPVEASKPGTALEILVRDKPIPAEVVRPPFHKGGTVKK